MNRSETVKKFSGSAEKLITDVYNVGYGAGYMRAVQQERDFIKKRGGGWLYEKCETCGYCIIDRQHDGRAHCMINNGAVVNFNETCPDHWRANGNE